MCLKPPLVTQQLCMGRQGVPNYNFHQYTLKNSELAKKWPSSGPTLWRISTYVKLGTDCVKDVSSLEGDKIS